MKTKGLKFLSLAIALSTLAACAGFQRSHSSGYDDRDGGPGEGRDYRAYEREKARDEMGFRSSTLNDQQAEAVELRTALHRAEQNLEGKREREQYYRNKPYMRNDRERLDFLSLDSYETRARWLAARGIQENATAHPPNIQALIDVNDITLGMTRQAVRDSWGEPELIEVAGNPIYGNERWHYSEQTSSTEGFQTEHRLVYFQSGRVSGWEKR